MTRSTSDETRRDIDKPAGRCGAILDSLVPRVLTALATETGPFAVRLSEAFLAFSEGSADPREIAVSFQAATLLRNNAYPFHYLFSQLIEERLGAQLRLMQGHADTAAHETSGTLTLVEKEALDELVQIGNISRLIEAENTEQLSALDIRLAHLLDRDDLTTAQNPFRPEIFVSAACEAWRQFNPDNAAHPLLPGMFKPDVFLDLDPVLRALNDALIAQGVLPDLADAYRIQKARNLPAAKKRADDAAINERLKNMLSGGARPPAPPIAGGDAGAPALPAAIQEQMLQAAMLNRQLLGYVAGVQKELLERHSARTDAMSSSTETRTLDTSVLTSIKMQAQQGALSRGDESAIDLLTHVFDVVFRDPHIPAAIKALIGTLQVPVLKAALLDKDFFFDDGHPARRLIGLLAQSGVAWDQSKGDSDPFYQNIERNVSRVRKDVSESMGVFADALADVKSFLHEDDDAMTQRLAAPISKALKQERLVEATRTARSDVALRVGTGEVVAFVEAFLEQKWVPVLTFAYSVQEDKPEAVQSALQTMDDLVWSVKPKITQAQRKELIEKLPAMLAALNKWASIIEWSDAERLQFFAELAECHASIVRAPLELSPKRQLEIAMEAAQQAAARRLERRTAIGEGAHGKPHAAPELDVHDETVRQLKRGVWIEFMQKDDAPRQLRLAWVSPQQSLYIFSTRERKESLSISATDLAKRLRKGLATLVELDKLVGKALSEAVEREFAAG